MSDATDAEAMSFQGRVAPWMEECFGAAIGSDITERCDRLVEEVFETVQSVGYEQARIVALKDYVYARPNGELVQEVGGVMVTLAAFCLATGVDMHEASEVELARVWTKVEQIRAKQKAKPTGSALPVRVTTPHPSLDGLIQAAETEALHRGDQKHAGIVEGLKLARQAIAAPSPEPPVKYEGSEGQHG